MRTTHAFLLTLSALLAVAACSGGTGEPEKLCTPNEQRSCFCQDGASGFQSCDAEGQAFTACTCGSGGSSSSSSSSSGGGGTSSSSSSAGGPVNRAPSISVTTDDTTLYDSGYVVFTATVSDPDGAGDIADVLLSDTQGAAYGSFTRFSEGTYTLRINWNAIDASRAIAFPANGQETRTFVATVIDRASARATAQVSLVLACSPDEAACAGRGCINVQYAREDCGACGNSCTALSGNVGSRSCSEGVCRGELNHVPQQSSCSSLCGAQGWQCSQAFGHYSNDACAEMVDCSQTPPSTSSQCDGTAFVDVYCVCTR